MLLQTSITTYTPENGLLLAYSQSQPGKLLVIATTSTNAMPQNIITIIFVPSPNLKQPTQHRNDTRLFYESLLLVIVALSMVFLLHGVSNPADKFRPPGP